MSWLVSRCDSLGALSGLLPGRGEEFSELKVWLSKVSWGHHACLATVYWALWGGGLAQSILGFGILMLSGQLMVTLDTVQHWWKGSPAPVFKKKHASKLWHPKSSVQHYHADSSPLDPKKSDFCKEFHLKLLLFLPKWKFLPRTISLGTGFSCYVYFIYYCTIQHNQHTYSAQLQRMNSAALLENFVVESMKFLVWASLILGEVKSVGEVFHGTSCYLERWEREKHLWRPDLGAYGSCYTL